jgi:hypothetical protein
MKAKYRKSGSDKNILVDILHEKELIMKEKDIVL